MTQKYSDGAKMVLVGMLGIGVASLAMLIYQIGGASSKHSTPVYPQGDFIHASHNDVKCDSVIETVMEKDLPSRLAFYGTQEICVQKSKSGQWTLFSSKQVLNNASPSTNG